MDEEFEKWKTAPTPENMSALLDKAEPVINSALTSYAGGNQLFRGHARRMAAEAFKTYDPKKNVKLHTHLMTQLQPLTRINREHAQSVKVPERVTLDMYSMRQSNQELFDKLGREPSDKELADHTHLSMRRLQHVRRFARPDIPESGLTMMNEEGEQEIFYPGMQKTDPQRVWTEYVHHDLSPVDQKILEWKTGLYGKEILSNNEIAQRVNLSPGAVSQHSSRILQRIAEGQNVPVEG